MKAADQLHSALLDSDTVKRLEPAALSLVQHMWALSDAVRLSIAKLFTQANYITEVSCVRDKSTKEHLSELFVLCS